MTLELRPQGMTSPHRPHSMSSSTKESIAASLDAVRRKLEAAHSASSLSSKQPQPRLVAVSKTKPPEMVRWAYDCGQRHFGENYVQELTEKAQSPVLAPLDVRWHFIGHLQRNKVNSLASTPGLWMVETVDSERLATALDNSWRKRQPNHGRLKMYVQVNTSGEEAKCGCRPEDVPQLARHVQDKCTSLEFCGLMTIGKMAHDYDLGPNPDFEVLVGTREELCARLGLEAGSVELSMGMSADYEQAVTAGSSNVRMGSVIFGARTTTKHTKQ